MGEVFHRTPLALEPVVRNVETVGEENANESRKEGHHQVATLKKRNSSRQLEFRLVGRNTISPYDNAPLEETAWLGS